MGCFPLGNHLPVTLSLGQRELFEALVPAVERPSGNVVLRAQSNPNPRNHTSTNTATIVVMMDQSTPPAESSRFPNFPMPRIRRGRPTPRPRLKLK